MLWVAVVAMPGAAQPGSLGTSIQSIVDGRPETGREAVVYIVQSEGRCSGSLIGQRLVLTAKHCVQDPFADAPVAASEVSVGVGENADEGMQFYRVVDVVVAGGVYTESDSSGVENLLPDDIAILTLQRSPNVAPLALSFDDPKAYEGTLATAVGFGQTPSNARGGIKMSVTTKVEYVNADSLLVGSTVCPGDSGGPLIDQDDQIIGVVSQGVGDECGIGVGYYNRIDLHQDLIMQAFARAGELPGQCVASGDEVCDGFDNNCNGQVDEGCLALGEKCQADDECIGGRCEHTPAGQLCTASCDPLHPTLGCPEGLRCINTGQCEGLCAPGVAGGKVFGAACERDDECASLFCKDPGDGNRRCLAACRSGTDSCLSGEACVAPDGACGPCVDANLVSSDSPLGFGEPCTDGARCRSRLCIQDADLAYCSAKCKSHGDCPVNAHCRSGQCVRGNRVALGGPCFGASDCSAGLFCTASGAEGFCSMACKKDADCGDGLTCQAVSNGKACVPVRGVLGDVCEADADCISGLCDSTAGRCTRACAQNAACGSGFECVRRDGLADGVCLPGGAEVKAAPSKKGGCSVGSGALGSFAWGLSLLGLALRGRLRRRRG